MRNTFPKDSVASLVAGRFEAAHQEVCEAEPRAFGVFEFAVKGDVFRFLQSDAGVGEKVEPVGGKLGDLVLGPFLGIGEEWLKVLDRSGDGGAAFAAGGPQVDALGLGD